MNLTRWAHYSRTMLYGTSPGAVFKAHKGDQTLSMKGIDLLRIEKDVIAEVWLFSEKIEEEDAFWTSAAGS